MRMRDFIKENKGEIDKYILSQCKNCHLNNKERKLWILNDERLYSWARGNKVNI